MDSNFTRAASEIVRFHIQRDNKNKNSLFVGAADNEKVHELQAGKSMTVLR